MTMQMRIVLTGQTCSGKNTLAALACSQGPFEIISMDSMKVYAGMDIGTAKPSPELRKLVPHHLIDIRQPDEYFDAADYFETAEAVCADITSRGNIPVFVGGTPMYLKIMIHGIFAGPAHDDSIRQRLKLQASEQGIEALHADLARVDPVSAASIHGNDAKRIIRALEVFELTQKPLSQQQQQFDRPRSDVTYAIFGLDWPRAELYARINARVDEMFDAGWIAETIAIRDSTGFGEQSSKALGYREILDLHLAQGLGEAQTRENVKTNTRRFAKRQMTWLRRFDIAWLQMQKDRSRDSLVDEFAAVLARLTDDHKA